MSRNIKERTLRRHALRTLLGLGLVALLITLWFSTATTQPFIGNPLKTDAATTDRHATETATNSRSRELLVMLGFSGGGTRAAALAYGVLEELAATRISTSVGERRLLDEIDAISSVSGGSFTSAYFGLFGDRIFDDFKNDMLLQPIESDLLKAVFDPRNWRNLSSPYYGRSDLAVAYYEKNLFHNKTFADLNRPNIPWIIINASDIGSGERVVFTQNVFKILCIDYGSYPIARAVSASSAVPGVTTPIALKNRAGDCPYTLPDWLDKSLKSESNPMLTARAESVLSYLDVNKRPWLHLVDGGITDNLGLREYYEITHMENNIEHMLRSNNSHPEGHSSEALALASDVTDILIISVNAAAEHQWDWAKTPQTPTEEEALGAMTHIEMHNFTSDTLHIVQEAYLDWEDRRKNENGNEKPANFDFVEIAFSEVADEKEKAYLNALPTSMQLSEEQVDTLIAAGRHLLRQSPNFQQFIARHKPDPQGEPPQGEHPQDKK